MKVIILVLCLTLSVSVFAQWEPSSWTDSVSSNGFGGTLFLCFDDDDVSGAYSEYGLVQGTRNGNRITGNFYEGGSGNCVTGSFEWTIASNGNTFDGTYTCADDDEEIQWSETRTGDSNTVSNTLCAVLSTSTIDGSYRITGSDGNTYDICVDDDEYELSYFLALTGVDGYESGVVYENGVIGGGEYIEDAGASGISLVFRLRDGNIGNFYWGYDDDGEIDTVNDVNTDLHGYDLFSREGNASSSECSANNNLLDDDNGDDDNDSASNTLIASVFLLFTLALF